MFTGGWVHRARGRARLAGIPTLFGALALGLLVAALLSTLVRTRSPAPPNDPRFVVTTAPVMGAAPTATVLERASLHLLNTIRRLQGPRPLAYSFPASPTNRCSIHGLLNQCTEVTGVRYVIAKDVAAGSVALGQTGTLNGAQWVAAVTEALRNGPVDWWDPQAQTFHREGLVLHTNDRGHVLVIPAAMAADLSGLGTLASPGLQARRPRQD